MFMMAWSIQEIFQNKCKIAVDEKSILAVLEQIHVKTPIDQRKLWETVENEIKVGVSGKKSSLLHSWHSYGSGALIRINFRPQTAEK